MRSLTASRGWSTHRCLRGNRSWVWGDMVEGSNSLSCAPEDTACPKPGSHCVCPLLPGYCEVSDFLHGFPPL